MAGWNGAGVFVRAMNWVADKAASIKIIASRMDTEFDNYKTGLENCLTRDGQTPPTADIPWNSKKITGLASGVASTDAANLGQVTGVTSGNAFRRNMLINGGFDVWQSGAGGSASIAGAATRTRTADCWWAIRQGTTGYTVSQQTGEANRFALKWQRDSANASTQNMLLSQSIETATVVWLKRGTPPSMVCSFYAKKGANYSGGDLTAEVVHGTGTDQNVLDGYTGAATIGTLTQTLTGTLTRYSFTVTPTASTNEMGVRFTWTPTGAAGADDSVTIENVQLEVASAATAFEYLPFSETLQRCLRYFQKTFGYGVAPVQNGGVTVNSFNYNAGKAGAGSPVFSLPMFAPMREVTHSAVFYNPQAANAFARNLDGAADTTATSLSSAAGAFRQIYTHTQAAGTAAGDRFAVDYTIADPNF